MRLGVEGPGAPEGPCASNRTGAHPFWFDAPGPMINA